jgi:serine/threonine-protein kinase
MSFWSRLLGVIGRPPIDPGGGPGAGQGGGPGGAAGGGQGASGASGSAAGAAKEGEPSTELPSPPLDETWLRTLLIKMGEGDTTARSAVGEREFWAAIGRLTANGRERTAIDLLARFAAAKPEDPQLLARLCELLCDRREDAAARSLLEQLLAFPAHALRARFLLGEIAERAGDEETARRHFEAILAVDLDHPKVRSRVDRLRRPPVKPTAPPAAPTLMGLDGGGSGALAGRYRLVRELGRGAAGAVYVARDEELDRDLALKILHPQARGAPADARARAFSEARLAAAIRHPGVVAVYDLDEERQLVAMELCGGGSLKERLSRGPLAPAEALARAGELLATLTAVHRTGVVHGDVKPANLLFRGDDLVLGDFGVARLVVGDKPIVDERGARGTLAYMAPEQRRGELSTAADLYAAGVVLLELLRGTRALEAWLGDRAALLRGEARWDGQLPEAPAAAPLARALTADEAAKRPTAAEALAQLHSLVDAMRP